jgi:hypothetical protein
MFVPTLVWLINYREYTKIKVKGKVIPGQVLRFPGG